MRSLTTVPYLVRGAVFALLFIIAAGLLFGPLHPISANPLTDVAAVATGGHHTCAVTTTGDVKCWGRGLFGQLGDGTSGLASVRTSPVDVTGLANGAIEVTAAETHTCALTASGGVKCWGHGGLLGDGTGVQRNTPVDVVGLTSGVSAVAAGSFLTCALTTSGGVKCWGSGYGLTPEDVPSLTSGVTGVTAGGDGVGSHACALTTQGGVMCWGYNSRGQLGDGTMTDRTEPVYSVRFEGAELWGQQAEPNHAVYIDMWESYLEPA